LGFMAQRMEIELTAKQSEQTWSWRAAGAKLPKGTLPTTVLYDGAKVGDVIRAEAEVGIDGIEILSVAPPFVRREKQIERIEIKAEKKFEPVTTDLKKKREKKGKRERPQKRRDNEDSRARTPRTPRAPRLTPSMKHRGAILDTLEGQQRHLAELLLKGGMPAVRRSLEQDVRSAADAGQTQIDISPLLTAAEDMWPTLKTAEWMDKAEAALGMVNEISLRDLRAVVTTGDSNARTDESRALVQQLREALDRRSEESKTAWLSEIETCLNDGRIIRALKISSRPPDPSVKFPAELAQKLTEAANSALAPDIEVDRWLAVLEAVTTSPVRRSVVPAGLPADKDDPALAPAKSAAAKVPALSKMFGLTIPPPPTGRIAPPRKKPAKKEEGPPETKMEIASPEEVVVPDVQEEVTQSSE
jgi:hypothetical protein